MELYGNPQTKTTSLVQGKLDALYRCLYKQEQRRPQLSVFEISLFELYVNLWGLKVVFKFQLTYSYLQYYSRVVLSPKALAYGPQKAVRIGHKVAMMGKPRGSIRLTSKPAIRHDCEPALSTSRPHNQSP
jgi:hypothetical protein